MISITDARAEDLDAVRALLEDSGLPEAGLSLGHAVVRVVRNRGTIVGCAALERYGEDALLRSVAVAPNHRGRSLGTQMTLDALNLARRHGIRHVYLLTTSADAFFSRIGFREIARRDVPPGVRSSTEFAHACPESARVLMKDVAPRSSPTNQELP